MLRKKKQNKYVINCAHLNYYSTYNIYKYMF